MIEAAWGRARPDGFSGRLSLGNLIEPEAATVAVAYRRTWLGPEARTLMNMELQAVLPIIMLIDGSRVDRLKSKLGQVIDLHRLVAPCRRQGRAVRPAYDRDSRDSSDRQP